MDRPRRHGGSGWWNVGVAALAAGVVGVIASSAVAQHDVQEAQRAEVEAQLRAQRAEAQAQRAQAEAQGEQQIQVRGEERAAPAAEADPEADADAEADLDAVAEMDAEKLAERFEVVPASFNSNSYLHFDDEGKVRNEQHNMSMNLNVLYDPEVAPRAYRNFTIDRMVTDAGEELKVQHHMAGEQQIHNHHHMNMHMHGGNERPRFSLHFNVSFPREAAETVRRLEGSIEVVMPVGEPRHALLKPVNKILGKQVHIANYPGSQLHISRDEHERLAIRMNADLAALLTQVRFYGSDGGEIPVQERGSSRSNDQHTTYYQFDLPEDGQIMLTFRGESRAVRVPFVLEDIPLPQPGGDDRVDLVIRAEPGEPVVQNAGPGEGDLELTIE